MGRCGMLDFYSYSLLQNQWIQVGNKLSINCNLSCNFGSHIEVMIKLNWGFGGFAPR